ncbi:DNA polymerase delta small subunit Cdc1 [Malassezia caprae]|uniref:DNA polymerase delta small subunit Cdc1 n=1 Tax=Malassezia caprae TaxID=1381934 RepID=A0AAF0E6N7_9BASI|nr:DNA polymerase delta small subunit Cdc1 [Malassezia caprae]
MPTTRTEAAFDALPALSDALHVPASERTYGRQFAQMYDYRLAVLRRRVLQQSEDPAFAAEHGQAQYIERLLDIPPRTLCLVIGTFYCAMRHKPDVLQEIARDLSLPAPLPVSSYVDSEHDELFLEDQSGRVRLVGELVESSRTRQCVTGAVAGVVGVETPEGDLEVRHVFFPGLPAPVAMPGAPTPGLVVLASGFLAGDDAQPQSDMAMELLLEWLTGELAAPDAQARISSMVIAGNAVRRSTWAPTERQQALHNPFAAFDPWLDQVCATLDAVVLQPGAQDPSGTALPQQPFLAPLLPRAARWPSLHRVTNPAWFALHHRSFLCTGGQNLDDLLKYVPDAEQAAQRLPLARAPLRWAHVAPTAPDTLWCYPFKATDPFVLRAAPDVYVVGNQPAFATETLEVPHAHGTHTVRLVLVPEFASTQQVVVLDAETLEARAVSFRP